MVGMAENGKLGPVLICFADVVAICARIIRDCHGFVLGMECILLRFVGKCDPGLLCE